ncbi:MAG: sulfatase-like hydrolase/transferase [Planctomycetota bacterium]|jgi:arylsulfatase A-like enzyme
MKTMDKPKTDGISRRQFLKSSATAVSLTALAASIQDKAYAAETSKMNVLFIDIEDCAANVWGCYGNTICQTPNIDRLAATGVRFTAAHCQGVCCNPSRVSFLTGLRPSSTHIFQNSQPIMEYLPEGTPTLPELVKKKGFYAANVAKLFHGKHKTPQLAVFDRLEMTSKPAGWKGPDPILTFPPLPKELRSPPAPRDQNSKEYQQWRRARSSRWGVSGLTDEQEHDGKVARIASALLKEFSKTNKHFFLSVGSSRPHTPLICPKKYIDMYDPEEIPWPPAPPAKDKNVPGVATSFGRSHDIYPEPAQSREVIAAYYGCVTFLDTQLGMVLDTLEETGLAKNTIVVFFADHGFHLGEHGVWSKYTLFEATTRVPLIVRVPGAPGNGKTCHELVELVDLVATLGDLIGLDLPNNLEGTSFVPLLVDPSQPWKKAAFTEWGDKGKTMRTKPYRYTERLYQGELVVELYDHETDPWETVNLAGDPAYAATRAELAKLFHSGWKAALPPEK